MSTVPSAIKPSSNWHGLSVISSQVHTTYVHTDRMLTMDMIRCKCRDLYAVNIIIRKIVEDTHKIVAMIIPFVTPYPNLNFVVSGKACSLEECLGMKLIEEIVRSSLRIASPCQCVRPQNVPLQYRVKKIHT